MLFSLTSALSVLLVFSNLAPGAYARGNSRFYYIDQSCKGNLYVEFDIKETNLCYNLRSGTAAALYSSLPNVVNVVRAFRGKGKSDCGQAECIISAGESCCWSKDRRISGAQLFQIEAPCRPLPACLGINRLELAEKHGSKNCTSVDDIGEPFIELSDGTHFGLGVGKLGKLTAEELQEGLVAKGKERLSGERIAELVEVRFIKSE
ncbi:hypothetical protein TARUN_2058 [Trichoderma arundinaceum]|uniref:Uncharacterized protein n=1 Tax=Trichoderma arundinaceum TaxID=490622 RepID=A0A395NVX2_TRIAR|nr:hypothetical protein TARUN_2058 [Trichoderma arundinaceum]